MKIKDTLKKQIVRFSEFMVGGGAQFWSGYAAFALFDKVFGWPLLLSTAVAYFMGASVNFAIERFWVFGGKHSKKDTKKSAKKFYALMVVNFLLNLAIIWGLKQVGISPYIGQFISAAFFTAWNYLVFSKWVFKKDRRKMAT